MRVLRGRADSIDRDRAVTAEMLAEVGETGVPAVRVWQPHRQVAFGRRDANEPGYEAAKLAAEVREFTPVERSVGGRAVAYTGTTLAFARATPVEELRAGISDRYERMTSDVQRALWKVGVPAQRGEPPNSFCPGSHSIQYTGKIAGIAQRVRGDAALCAGVLVVDGHHEIGTVLAKVYDHLDVPFDPDSVGSVERASGRSNPEKVRAVVEDRLVGDHQREIEPVE